MSDVAIINGTLVDVTYNASEKRNLLLRHGCLSGMGYIPDEDEEALSIIDVTGKVIVPSIMDLGGYSSEDFSEFRSAYLRSGITASTVCFPSVDKQSCSVESGGPDCIKGVALFSESGDLNDLSIAKKEGCAFVSYCFNPDTLDHLSEALPFLDLFKLPLCIDLRCSSEDYASLCTVYGCEGRELESCLVSLIVDRLNKGSHPIHFMGLTATRSIDLVYEQSAHMTCSVSPFVCGLSVDQEIGLSESGVYHYSVTQDHREGLKDCVVSGKVDVLSSAIGLLGSSNMTHACVSLLLPLLYQVFVTDLEMSLDSVYKMVSTRPYDILSVDRPRLGLGARPHLTIVDTQKAQTVSQVVGEALTPCMDSFLSIESIGLPFDVYFRGESVQLTS